MNAFFLVIPLLLIRYLPHGLLNKNALQRAAHFPASFIEARLPYLLYQLSTFSLIIIPFFLKVNPNQGFFIPGMTLYIGAIIILGIATLNFAKPNNNGLNINGIYRLSRNPMYVGYFLYFWGCALMAQSPIYLIFTILFQITSHRLIREEEMWCMEHYGQEYKRYIAKVKRYI